MSYNLDYPWGLSESVFHEITKSISPNISKVVEFGCGTSSLRLADYFQNAQVISIESSSDYISEFYSKYEDHPLLERISIKHQPLKWQIFKYYIYQTYLKFTPPEDIDLVIIDGPPFWTRRGREACMHMILKNVAVGGKIVLDDAHRRAEKKIVSNWHRMYANCLTFEYRNCGNKNICVMTKMKQTIHLSFNINSVIDNYLRFSRLQFDKVFFPARLKPSD